MYAIVEIWFPLKIPVVPKPLLTYIYGCMDDECLILCSFWKIFTL